MRILYREYLMPNVYVGNAAIPAIGFGTYGMRMIESIPASGGLGCGHPVP
jgi:hypothetical protein